MKRILLKWKWLKVVAISLLSTFYCLGQKQITGIVTAKSDRQAIPGVSVVLKGSKVGTFTNEKGFYAISANEGDILSFSFIGMKPMELRIQDQVEINLELEDDNMELSEVVIVGYGVQKKENLSGAVDVIDVGSIDSRPINNLAQGLQGLSPNLNIDFNSGAPGQAAKINIRGLTSINGGDPLILIDGVPSDPMELNRLAPEDVDKISVLKDASSAAIYGARAAFGVILISTKEGTSDGVGVSYSNNFAMGMPTIITPEKVTDPYIYLRIRETSTDNTPWDNQNYSDETYSWARDRSNNPSGTQGVRINPNDPSSWEYMGNQDWTNYFLESQTLSQNHHLSINGKSDRTSYLLSGSFNRQNGVLKIADDFFDRYTLRGKVNFKLNDRISIGNNTFLTATSRENPSSFSIWDLYNFHPTDFDKNPDGTWANTTVGFTGARLTNGGTFTDNYNSLQTTINAEIKLIPEKLTLRGDYTTRRGSSSINSFNTMYQIGYGPEDVREEGVNNALRANETTIYNVANLYATYNNNFGSKNLVSLTAGYNQEAFRSEYFSAYRDGIISASLPTIALATGDAQVSENIGEWAVKGAFYRLNYNYDEKYILEFNGRYDGSSRFPQENRFGFFPSASAAWRITNESFMANQNWLSNLKFRASYGSLGNQSVGNYGYIPTMNAVNGSYILGNSLPQRITPPAIVSSNYTWEDVTSTNFGLDFGLLSNKLSGTLDIYSRNTLGMLTLGRDLPDVLGANEPLENAADLRTSGWEFSLNFKDRFSLANKPFTFDARFVISDNRSVITRFDNPNNNLTQYYEGMEIGEIWGLESNGFFRSQEEIDALDQSSLIPWGAINITEGWPKFVDQDGNGAIEKALTTTDSKDLKVIGNMTPRYRFGVNLNMTWANFDLNTIVQGIGKRDYYPLDYLYWGFYQQPYAGGYTHLLDFYRATDDSEAQRAKHSEAYIQAGLADANTDAKYPHLQAWLADRNLGERIDQSKGLAIPQTAYLLNAAFVRLKNVTLGYSLPNRLTEKVGVNSFRVFISGENLLEWSQLSNFYDPEAISDSDVRLDPSNSPGRGAGSGYQYPFQRRYSAGISLNF